MTAFAGQYHGPLHGKLTYHERQKLSDKEFAIPSERKYPIDTADRARNALARVSAYGTPEEKRKVQEAVRRRYPQIDDPKGKLPGSPFTYYRQPSGVIFRVHDSGRKIIVQEVREAPKHVTPIDEGENTVTKLEARGYSVDYAYPGHSELVKRGP